MQTFYSNGKLLLSGEYVVLDGALSLAVPTKFGQSLEVESIEAPKIVWKSLDKKGAIWFENEFLIKQITTSLPIAIGTPRNGVSDRIIQILNAARKLNPHFLNSNNGFKVTTKLDFPRNWGLGTSSTLINNIAQWADVDAYKLLEMTFGGSGYDIACAQNDTPITYQLRPFESPQVDRQIKSVVFDPSFKEHLYFVYLNQKQNSREGILRYKENKGEELERIISKINDITSKIIDCDSLNNFEKLITEHEDIISNLIKLRPIKEQLFSDFQGSIKSLGAWGGDFVLVASEINPKPYFQDKGFNTILSYSDMAL